jgi:hypothetical protein
MMGEAYYYFGPWQELDLALCSISADWMVRNGSGVDPINMSDQAIDAGVGIGRGHLAM